MKTYKVSYRVEGEREVKSSIVKAESLKDAEARFTKRRKNAVIISVKFVPSFPS